MLLRAVFHSVVEVVAIIEIFIVVIEILRVDSILIVGLFAKLVEVGLAVLWAVLVVVAAVSFLGIVLEVVMVAIVAKLIAVLVVVRIASRVVLLVVLVAGVVAVWMGEVMLLVWTASMLKSMMLHVMSVRRVLDMVVVLAMDVVAVGCMSSVSCSMWLSMCCMWLSMSCMMRLIMSHLMTVWGAVAGRMSASVPIHVLSIAILLLMVIVLVGTAHGSCSISQNRWWWTHLWLVLRSSVIDWSCWACWMCSWMCCWM